MTITQVCMLLLVLALIIGSARYLMAFQGTEKSLRPKLWRILMILSLQASSAVLLYFTLFPPPTFTSAEKLVLLTANADTKGMKLSGRVIALPEAPASAQFEQAPDLATALRRTPGVSHLQIIGAGLSPRDQASARGLSIEFAPLALPSGLVELSLPTSISVGARWQVQGRINKIKSANVELLDPGNNVVAKTDTDKDGKFALADKARSSGLAVYQLRILDATKKVQETIALPINIVQTPSVKVLSLSGGPNPELKYLRRWAVDAGVDLQSQINLSTGMQMNSANIAINAASLREIDMLILDERAWSTMGGASKQAMLEALRGGMGLLLRITGPLTANNRNELRALGFAVNDANIVQTVRLNLDGDKKIQPALTRRPLRVISPDAVTLLQDDANNALALWRAEGRGRIGLIWLSDSYQLVLSDHANDHAQLWRNVVSTLARTHNENAAYLRSTNARINERTVLCNIADKAFVQSPDAEITYLLKENVGANKNCAAVWPRSAGWHVLLSKETTLPFYVRDSDEAPGLKANAIREATLLLAAKKSTAINDNRIPVPGSAWPWFSVWLLLTTALWLLERSKLGLRS